MSQSVAWVLSLMMVLWVVESVFFPPRGRWRREHLPANLALSALALFFNLAFGAVIVAVAARLPPSRLPAWLQLVIAVVVLDGCTYLCHRLMHRPLLWRVHRIHHADPLVDVTTALRQHPLETLLRTLFIAVPALLLGLSPEALAAYRLVSAVNAVFEHSHVRLWQPVERALSLALCTPDMHQVHHSRAQSGANYGNILSLFDRLFGTFRRRPAQIDFGVDGLDGRQSLGALLRLPFRP